MRVKFDIQKTLKGEAIWKTAPETNGWLNHFKELFFVLFHVQLQAAYNFTF